MEGGARAAMVSGAVRLLATTGLAGTSFSEVLGPHERTERFYLSPLPGRQGRSHRGRCRAGRPTRPRRLDDVQNPSAMVVTTRFLAAWRTLLERSGQRAGCAVLAVTVDTTSTELLDQAAQVFRAWRTRLADQLVAQWAGRRDGPDVGHHADRRDRRRSRAGQSRTEHGTVRSGQRLPDPAGRAADLKSRR